MGKIITVDENKEVSFFWPHFPGGKKEYANAEYLKWNSKSPRLFLCSNTTGTFKVCTPLLTSFIKKINNNLLHIR